MIVKQYGVDALAPKVFEAYADEGQLRDRIINDIHSGSDVFEEHMDIRNRNFEFYRGKQWTDLEVAAHQKQFREAYVFNEVQRIIDHLVGTQTQTRLDSRAVGREPGDDAMVEKLNYLIKWVEQVNEIEITETSVYTESLIGGASAAVVRWVMEDYNHGYPKIEMVPIDELQWDLNARKSDLSDARWMARIRDMREADAIEVYPQYEEEIQTASNWLIGDSNILWTKKSEYREEVLSALSTHNGEDSRRLLRMVEYYEKMKIAVYTVADVITGTTEVFYIKSEAENYYKGLEDEYVKNGTILIDGNMNSKLAILATTKDIIMQTVMAGDKVLYTRNIDYPDFPYVVNFAYFHDGEWWAFEDALISPQIMINRFLSQWDYQLGASLKNALKVITSLLPRGITIEDVRREASKTGPVFEVFAENAITPIPNQPVNPELFQGVSFSIQRINDAAGGRNMLGLQENAAESGKAVIARAEAGGIGRLPLFDRLRVWRKNIMLRVVWLIKNYMPDEQMMRIIGNNPENVQIDMDDMDLDTLKELKVDIEIDEAYKSDSIKERNFMALKELFQVTQLPPEVTIPLMLEYSALPRTKRDEIIKKIEEQKQFVMAQAQQAEAQKAQQDVERQQMRGALRELKTLEEDIEEKAKDVEEAKKDLQQQ